MADIRDEAARLLEDITPAPWAWEWIAEKSNEWAVGQAFDADGKPLEGCIPEGEWIEEKVIERRLVGMNESGHARAADAEFIAAAPRLVRDLLAELARVTEERDKAQSRLADAEFTIDRADEHTARIMAEVERVIAILRAACDRNWQDESLEQTASIASNAIYWAKQRAEQAEAERDRLRAQAAKLAEIRNGSPNAFYAEADKLIKLAALSAAPPEKQLGAPKHHPACDPGWGPPNYRCHPDCKVRAAPPDQE